MKRSRIERNYVSEYDKFLKAFDETHPKSRSQQKEIEKAGRIARLRDEPQDLSGESRSV